MAVYLVTYTPTGPYFFGNEKSFVYPGQKIQSGFGNQYYIRGEALPLQTTLLGALRYYLLPVKGFDKLGDKKNMDAVGKTSFNIEQETKQTFGQIVRLSPMFLCKGDEFFVPAPMDHNCDKPQLQQGSDNKKIEFYTPLQQYQEMQTPHGLKLYTNKYNAKKGVSHAFMSLKDCHLENDLFTTETRVGIQRSAKTEGFFKKEYNVLKKGYAFAVLAEINREGLDGCSDIVMLGQGKVPFRISFRKASSMDVLADGIRSAMERVTRQEENVWYCMGDVFLDRVDYETYYRDNLKLAIVETRDFRNYRTKGAGQVEKSSSLYRLIRAGSVFIPTENQCNLASQTDRQRNAQTIGWNNIIKIGGNHHE